MNCAHLEFGASMLVTRMEQTVLNIKPLILVTRKLSNRILFYQR